MLEKEFSTTVHSVNKAAILLEILLKHREPMTLRDLAKEAGFPKSTVHALLNTLKLHAMIEQQADGRYYLGIRLFECGCAVSAEWDISRIARPFLERLAEQTGATAVLTRLEGDTAISIDQCTAENGVQVVQKNGQRLCLYATSQGKLLLSLRSPDEVLEILEGIDLQPFTPHTITDIPTLQDNLSKIQSDGYAIEDGEFKIGLRSVSAPVYSHDGTISYALCVVGLFRRVYSEEFENAIYGAIEQAKLLSEALGYR